MVGSHLWSVIGSGVGFDNEGRGTFFLLLFLFSPGILLDDTHLKNTFQLTILRKSTRNVYFLYLRNRIDSITKGLVFPNYSESGQATQSIVVIFCEIK